MKGSFEVLIVAVIITLLALIILAVAMLGLPDVESLILLLAVLAFVLVPIICHACLRNGIGDYVVMYFLIIFVVFLILMFTMFPTVCLNPIFIIVAFIVALFVAITVTGLGVCAVMHCEV